jgi:hypothetical protein
MQKNPHNENFVLHLEQCLIIRKLQIKESSKFSVNAQTHCQPRQCLQQLMGTASNSADWPLVNSGSCHDCHHAHNVVLSRMDLYDLCEWPGYGYNSILLQQHKVSDFSIPRWYVLLSELSAK